MIQNWLHNKLHPILLRKFTPSEGHLQRLAEKHRNIRKFSTPTLLVEEYPEDTVAQLVLKGRLYLERKQTTEAIMCFEKAISHNARHNWAWHGKGDAHQMVGQYQDASVAYTQAMELAPQEAYHIAGLANAKHALGMHNLAQTLRNQAVQLSPDIESIFYW